MGLITNKISGMINTQLQVDSAGVKATVYDLDTIFAVQGAIVAYIEGRPITFEQRWFLEHIAFDLKLEFIGSPRSALLFKILPSNFIFKLDSTDKN